MQLRTLSDLGDLRGKRVLTRVDFNVPIAHRRVMDDTKVRFALPTIERLRAAGARVILCSHIGEGESGMTLAPVAALLQSLGQFPVTFLRQRIGIPALGGRIAKVRDGGVALLENLRASPGEVRNAKAFTRALASLADAYVNDAFGVCHRRHASIASTPLVLPSAAGLLLEREVRALSRLLEGSPSPFVALLGGAKISTKVPVIEHLLGVADVILLGGALASTFLQARGYGIGASLSEASGVQVARRLLHRSKRRSITTPMDVVVGDPSRRRERARVIPIRSRSHAICERPYAILDIGPETIRAYSQQLRSAATIVWNGPMGMFERKPFHHGSVALARVIAARSSGRAFGVVGGGETLAVLAQTGMMRYIDHVSTGGGAMLAFLAGEELPGLAPLIRRS